MRGMIALISFHNDDHSRMHQHIPPDIFTCHAMIFFTLPFHTAISSSAHMLPIVFIISSIDYRQLVMYLSVDFSRALFDIAYHIHPTDIVSHG